MARGAFRGDTMKLDELRARFKAPEEESAEDTDTWEQTVDQIAEDVRVTYVGVDVGSESGYSAAVVYARRADGTELIWAIPALPGLSIKANEKVGPEEELVW